MRPEVNAETIPANWTFETAEVAKAFDRHVREQLPWYDIATGALAHVARHYIPKDGLVYDIGASTGNVGRALAETLADRGATLRALEPSEEMVRLYQGPGEIICADALEHDFERFDVAVCFLVLMFMPVEKRPGFIADLRRKLRPGGAIIVFDKCLPTKGYSATVLWRLALAGKVAQGVPADEIVAKELSLSGVQRPIDPAILGGDACEWFRFGDFAGWLIEG